MSDLQNHVALELAREPNRLIRTQAVYEDFPFCPNPPLAPLPDIDTGEIARLFGFVDHPFVRRLIRAQFLLCGFRSFQKHLPETIESLLKVADLRRGVCGPLFSATMALADDPLQDTPLLRAAALLKSLCELHADIRAGRFMNDTLSTQPLEMRQYLNLFGTSVTWRHDGFRMFKSENVSHVAVLAGRMFYLLELGEDHDNLSLNHIASALQEIWALSKRPRLNNSEAAIGCLSSAREGTQTKTFRRLLKNPCNALALAALQNTFVTLCLDLDSEPCSYADAAKSAHVGNPANRWFHSSLQLVVFGNSRACAICNYSAYLDGNVMMRAGAELQVRAKKHGILSPVRPTAQKTLSITKLHWAAPPGLLEKAYADIGSLTDYQESTFTLQGYGRRSFESRGLNTVAAFMIALQLTACQLSGHAVNLTQAVTMSRYRYMDLAAAMISTPEMLKLTEAWSSPKRDPEFLKTLVHSAIQSQLRECRRTRLTMPVVQILGLFAWQRNWLRSKYSNLLLGITLTTLRLCGFFRPTETIIASHPRIFPEVLLLGRPGIRVPYLSTFALHYQIFEDHLTLTIMPGADWKVPNPEIVAELRTTLDDLFRLFIPT